MSRKSVLIIENDPTIRDLMKHALALRGFKVTCVAAGGKARERMQKSSFAIIIADMAAPGVRSEELQAALQRTMNHTRVILLASNGDAQNASSLLGNDAVVLRKPFLVKDFYHAVERIVPQRDE